MPKKESTEQQTTSDAIPFDLDRHYTVEDVMKILNKSDTTVYGYLRKRQLKSYRFGREFIITASQLNEFAESRRLKNMLVSGAMVEVPFAGLTDANLSTAILFKSAITELYQHDPEVFAGLRDWLDIQDLPQAKFPLPDLE
jgi:excisionase family DNA binding protein